MEMDQGRSLSAASRGTPMRMASASTSASSGRWWSRSSVKDRVPGRARGFGFIIFADPTVAERVMEKHTIDGRTVEAKKAVPRDDQQILCRSNVSIRGSSGPAPTKVFAGGLPSTITESDFKKYFDQFGAITDMVVMYDHNTQRPRGFGFITYDSEDAVDKVLLNRFHDLNVRW